jgi:hypothetical protein
MPVVLDRRENRNERLSALGQPSLADSREHSQFTSSSSSEIFRKHHDKASRKTYQPASLTDLGFEGSFR